MDYAQRMRNNLIAKKNLAQNNLDKFENKLLESFNIRNSEISNPELYWKNTLERENQANSAVKINKSQTEILNNENQGADDSHNTLNESHFSGKSVIPDNNNEEYLESMPEQNENNVEQIESEPTSQCPSSIKNDIPNRETGENENELILIKSKTILIDLIDKEIQRYTNKSKSNHGGESGAGDSNKICEKFKEEKQKRLEIIANIKKEIEVLEKFELSIAAENL